MTGRSGRGWSHGANQSQQDRWSCSKLVTCDSKSFGTTNDRTIGRRWQRLIVRSIARCWSIVASHDWLYHRSSGAAIDPSLRHRISRVLVRSVARSGAGCNYRLIVQSVAGRHDWSYISRWSLRLVARFPAMALAIDILKSFMIARPRVKIDRSRYATTADGDRSKNCRSVATPQSHRIVRFLDHTIGCDWAKVQSIGNVCYDFQQRSVAYRERSRGRVITNDWRISMERTIVGNRATSGSDQRLMHDQSWQPATDDTINRSLHPATDRTSNRGIQWPVVRALVASFPSIYTIIHGTRRPMLRSIVGGKSIARSIVASCDRSYDQSLRPTTDHTINPDTKRFGIAG